MESYFSPTAAMEERLYIVSLFILQRIKTRGYYWYKQFWDTNLTLKIKDRQIKFRLSAGIAVIHRLKPNKSPGSDKITTTMITNSLIWLFIFNAILRMGYFPLSCKLTDLVMIPKPGKWITQVSLYRSVRITA